MEGRSRLEHCSDVEVPTHPPDPLTNANYMREVESVAYPHHRFDVHQTAS